MDVLHWDDFSKLSQTVHILYLAAELGAAETETYRVCISNVKYCVSNVNNM